MPRQRGPAAVLLAVVVGTVLLAGMDPTRPGAAAGPPPPTQRVGVPAYFYPAGANLASWDRLRSGAPGIGTVIVTGLGLDRTVPDPNYQWQIERTRAAGIEVLGYLGTDRGDKPAAAAMREIDRAYGWYGADGIFFDEAVRYPVTCEQVGYYRQLGRHAEAGKAGATTVLNHGQILPECYAEVTDVMMNAETSAAAYRTTWHPWGWEEAYPPKKFWHLVHTAGTVAEMQQVVALSRAWRAGTVFVTSAGAGSPGGPYGSLPDAGYWKAVLAAAAS